MIYFVHCGVTGLTKIGYTGGGLGAPRSVGGVWARVRGFQTSCSTPLRVVSVIDGSRADERRLHREHADRRDHGEWFRDVTPPPTAYPLDGFRDDVCTKPLPTVDPAAMCATCECGATFSIRARAKPHARCSACRAVIRAAQVAARPAAEAERQRLAAWRSVWIPGPASKRGPFWSEANASEARAAGLSWSVYARRRASGLTHAEAISLPRYTHAHAEKRKSHVRDGVCAIAKRIAPDAGVSWATVRRVLRGESVSDRVPVAAILAHPLARAA